MLIIIHARWSISLTPDSDVKSVLQVFLLNKAGIPAFLAPKCCNFIHFQPVLREFGHVPAFFQTVTCNPVKCSAKSHMPAKITDIGERVFACARMLPLSKGEEKWSIAVI